MYVIHVSPLIRGTQLESLSYFSGIEYQIGSFLQVPVRGKTQSAIVLSCKPVSTTKTALKAATFSLRKLPNQENPVVIPETIRKTATQLAERYPSSAGAILFALLPPDVRNGLRLYPRLNISTHQEETAPYVLTARLDERIIHYKSHIRSAFAHRGSVLVVVPTASDIHFLSEELGQGIEERLVVLSSSDGKKKRDEAFSKLEDTSLAKLIITTPSYAYLERVDLTTIIVEQSASNHYKTRQRPYLDHRDALKTYASVSGRSIVFGDTVPRTEEEVYRREEKYLTYDQEAKRIAFPSPLTIVKQKDKPTAERLFELFSPELLRSAERALEAKGRVFLFAARRGLAPIVLCIDCGHIFRCPDSNSPYSLVRTTKNGTEERWFVCGTSGTKVRAADVCPECGSWRLRERGIGIQHIYDEWMEKMPKTSVTLMDHVTASTPKKAEKIARDFFSKKTGVLIGTQLALPFLNEGVDVSAVVSLDAARSVPTWRADESLFRMLLHLRECSQKEVIVQTRNETDALLTHATRGAVERFYDDEISLRQMLGYPPYSTFILLSWGGNTDAVTEVGKLVKERFTGVDVQYYANPNSTPVKSLHHALIRIDTGDNKTYAKVLDIVRALPPYIKAEVNPDRIV